jgi:peptide chain release factor 2
LSLSPGFWDDNKRATEILKNIKLNEYWVDLYRQVDRSVEDFAVLFEFWKAGDATEEETKKAYDQALEKIEEAEFKSTLNAPEDELPAVLQINSGAGGTESQDIVKLLSWIGSGAMAQGSRPVRINSKVHLPMAF